MAKIPSLQYMANRLLKQPYRRSKNKLVEQLLDHAIDLEYELSEWTQAAEGSWAISVAINPSRTPTSGYCPTQVHRYSSVYAARVWNMYRVSRLIVQSITLRIICGQTPSSSKADEGNAIERSIRENVNGICASVPYLLGQTLNTVMDKTCAASINTQPNQSVADESASARNGRFSLIWPLYVACSTPLISEEQKYWMRAQLHFIAECGSPQAHFAQHAESSILVGGRDHCRFDCV
jgi:hypothetical protein